MIDIDIDYGGIDNEFLDIIRDLEEYLQRLVEVVLWDFLILVQEFLLYHDVGLCLVQDGLREDDGDENEEDHDDYTAAASYTASMAFGAVEVDSVSGFIGE